MNLTFDLCSSNKFCYAQNVAEEKEYGSSMTRSTHPSNKRKSIIITTLKAKSP
ncbi:hypothetical protein SK128_025326, partial [Halocaridina rubra]